ncbi:MAG: 50S ribosomal protein L15 [bacterium]
MQLHELKPKHELKKRKRIGRGGKKGTYSGRGMNGQKSRAGAKFEPIIRSIIKRYPKLKGYRINVDLNYSAVVNLNSLEKNFPAGAVINPRVLLEKKLINKFEGKVPKVKILAKGELSKILNIENCQTSKAAAEKITKAGGEIK